MKHLYLRHEKSPPTLKPYEFVGPQYQSTWIDPLSKNYYVHEGRTIQELDEEGYVSVYLNLDIQERDKIISRSARWFSRDQTRIETKSDLFADLTPTYSGGIALFSYLHPEHLQELVTKSYASLQDAQNDAPNLGDFLQFLLRNHPGFSANGYAVAHDRPDCRVTITGLDFQGTPTTEQIQAFQQFSESADEKTLNPLFCWWD